MRFHSKTSQHRTDFISLMVLVSMVALFMSIESRAGSVVKVPEAPVQMKMLVQK